MEAYIMVYMILEMVLNLLFSPLILFEKEDIFIHTPIMLGYFTVGMKA